MKYSISFFTLCFVIIFNSCSTNTKWIQFSTKIKEGLHNIEVVNEELAFAYSYGTGNFYRSVDGGKNWNLTYQFDSLYYEQVQFVNAQEGWLVGSPHQIYHTKDGSNSWQSIKIEGVGEGRALIYGMCFQDAKTGYIALLNNQGTRIFQTKDAGEN